MKVLGISPLDKDASASLVEDGKILFAAGEERFSRQKQHSGFPYQAIQAALDRTGTKPEEIDAVAYAFLTWDQELEHVEKSFANYDVVCNGWFHQGLAEKLDAAESRIPERTKPVPGLADPNQRKDKELAKRVFYRVAGGVADAASFFDHRAAREFIEGTEDNHKHWQEELEQGLKKFGLLGKLKRFEHHLSHAANSYLASGIDRALIVTLDGYGTGLAGSISIGEGGKIRRLHNIRYPHSLGTFYEAVTSSLGFRADRHAGKIVGLAAYGDPDLLTPILLERFKRSKGDFQMMQNNTIWFSRYLAMRFPMIDVAAAYQRALEIVAADLVRDWVTETGCPNVVLSGGVTANVKMNQRIAEVPGVEKVFVYPNMGDGGCGTGLALYMTWPGGVGAPIDNVYFGPGYTPAEVRAALERENLKFSEPANLAAEVARRINGGEVVARFDGRMEYGPRALGNRSILYHGRDPEVNQWLNQRLGRTEFMPFAPVTMWEDRHECYKDISKAEHGAEFMTITFDCTPFMRQSCPAAVHVDNTARPQLVRREKNPGYYDILSEYKKLSGFPSLINTSFNMHEEPIVCSPDDAVRAFLDGRLDGLAIGPYYVESPRKVK
ncbi:MAG: carbamoyltransferase C-terminal domain-containing protein [Bryobacteraceae bacterium]